jgi:tRNA threonylcarbamoyladenosine biosynthesis protein TsaE
MTELVVPLPTRRATIQLGARLARHLAAGDLLALEGPLGAGKTFLTRALCRALGLPRDIAVTSPTFTLLHELETSPPVAHADLYRLADATAVRLLGLDAQRDDGRILVVEWGLPYLDLLGGDALLVSLAVDPVREARLRATGARSARVLAELADASGVL